MTRDEAVEMAGDDELLFADGFDDAILGVAARCGQPLIVIYDTRKVLDSLARQGMSEEEAEEYFGFNVVGAWVGDRTPGFLMREDSFG